LAQRRFSASTRRADPRGPPGSGVQLAPDEERALIVATERGDSRASRRLVECFLPAIGGVARRFDGGGQVQRSDLMQEGVAALLFAARRYDQRTETPFWAYASFWVRKAMQELVAEMTRPAALSDHAVRGLAQLKAARREHVEAHGAEPTSADLAAATGFALSQVESLLTVDRAPRGLEEPLGPDGSGEATFGDTIADPDAEQEYEHVLDEIEVHDLTGRLDDRERAVLSGHYGLGQPAQTLSGIGARLGLTAERVRQIEAEALAKLRRAAAEPPGAADDRI
jgi:RNA polymerase sigma factor (sigma-70 family)